MSSVLTPATAPQVSLVVPTYRTRELALRAVRSALEQHSVNVEVIAVDDGSDDGTASLLRTVRDGRLRVVLLESNAGPSAARNRAIEEARGTWVAPLDSDDWMDAGRLARLIHLAEAHGADLVADDVWLVRFGAAAPSGSLFGKRLTTPREFDAVRFVRAATRGDPEFLSLGLTKPIIRRRLLMDCGLRYDEQLRAHEDFHLYVRCVEAGGRFVAVPGAGYFYTCGRPGALMAANRIGNALQGLAANASLLRAAKDDGPLRAALLAQRRSLADNEAIQRVREPLGQGRLTDACRAAATPGVIAAFLRRVSAATGTWQSLAGRE